MTMTLSTKDLDTISGSLDLTTTVLMKAEDKAERSFATKASDLFKRLINLNPEEVEVAVVMTPAQARVCAHILASVFAARAFDYAGGLDGAVHAFAPGVGQADREALYQAFEEASKA